MIADILRMVHKTQSSHVGSALSIVDILEVLYGGLLEEGDHFILSKGHAAVALQGRKTAIPPDSSLGHGLSIGCGLALGDPENRTVVLLGDGEMQEGSVWEAIMFAARQNLKNLTAIVDANGLQGLGWTLDGDFGRKFDAFGWEARIVKGHDRKSLLLALEPSDRPLAIIARTVKGKGVSFMENRLEWHYKSPNDEELALALAEQ